MNHRVTPEIKYMHLMEAFEEAQLRFLLARYKGETIRQDGQGQSRLISRRWK
ncbi:hypothetical protein [Methanobacterium oryzae]|uniref:hypothetical protein n=1 Tax=Methanobacterium oryzae TaxID=69540 RepID=UPI003D1A75BD